MKNFLNAVQEGADFADETPPYRGVSAISDQPGGASALRKAEQREYELRLRAVPGPWRASPEQRLRGLLKFALRAFGFRCEACRPRSEPAHVVKPPGRKANTAGNFPAVNHLGVGCAVLSVTPRPTNKNESPAN